MFEQFKRFSLFNVSGKLSLPELCSEESFHQVLEKERYRSDRSDHHYSLLVFSLYFENKKTAALQKAVRRIQERIRTVDTFGWYDEKRLGIILPYTTKEGAEKLAEEICPIIAPCGNGQECVECDIFCYASGTPGMSDKP
jgi:hypothetical protein